MTKSELRKLNPTSLGDKQRLFSRLLVRLLRYAHRCGYEVRFAEAYRTPEQAKLNAAKGSGIANSLHCDRLAIDLVVDLNGRWLQRTEDYAKLGAYWKNLHPLCRWGGDFGSRPDGNHFSIGHAGRA